MKWPLNVNNFDQKDIDEICSFLKNPNSRWTQDNFVEDFENKFSEYVGCKYAVFVSSGSTANTIYAMYLKDRFKNKKIVFPSTTWITSISPFIREGFEPVFVDVNLDDFFINLDNLEVLLKNDSSIKHIFATSLLGFTPDIDKLNYICQKFDVKIALDNCENTFGEFDSKNISSYFTSTTSTYFGHQIQSIEGGFLFTNSEEEYEYFLMARNHGMVRSLKTNKNKYKNDDVDSRFDFNILGNNFRNTNLNAFIGLLDFSKISDYTKLRIDLYELFKKNISEKYLLPKNFANRKHVAFSLPIICESKEQKDKKIKECEKLEIETRPIISGNLLRQTALKKYGNFENFKNSELLHQKGFYVGLHAKLKKDDILNLTNILNND